MSTHEQRLAYYRATQQQREIDLLRWLVAALLEDDEPQTAEEPVKAEPSPEELKRRKQEEDERWSYG